MIDNLKKFMEELSQNEDLKKELQENPVKTVEELCETAKRFGVELTEDAIQTLKSADKELTPEEIDKISGGLELGCGDSAIQQSIIECKEPFGVAAMILW